MKIQNTINKEIGVTIFGKEYIISANGILKNIPEEVALYWKGLHEFLIVSEDDKAVEKTETETKEPIIKEPVAEKKTAKTVTPKETK